MNAADELLGPALQSGLGDAPALIGGHRTLTFAELDVAACRAAGALAALGVGVDDRVLLLVDDRPEFFTVYLGVMKLGAVPVALNLRLSAEDLAYIVGDSGARALLVDPVYRDMATAAVDGGPCKLLLSEPGGDLPNIVGLCQHRPAEFPSVSRLPDDMAFWMYTSGTTGSPKAVVHRQAAVPASDNYLRKVYGIGPGDRIFCSSKLFFAFSLGHSFLGALRLGACSVIHTGWPAPADIAAAVRRHRPTAFFSVPTFYRNLLAEGLAGRDAFGSVRLFVSAGEQLPEPVCRQWYAATGRYICEGIGATETLVMYLGNRPDSPCPGRTGLPFPDCEVELRDEAGNPVVEADRPGVAWVRSPTVATGYWNQPEKTAAVFVDGRYCTGDSFTRDGEGRYRYQGRADDMLKISGQWVSPVEIEKHVLEHPDVEDAAAVGVANADGLVRLVLCLTTVGKPDREALERELTEKLLLELSVYKCPRRFLYLEDLPRTPTGKVQRFRLRQLAAPLVTGIEPRRVPAQAI